MNPTKPKHFRTAKGFTRYILEVALRDRQALADAWTPKYGQAPDEGAARVIAETKAEIAAIQERIRRLG